jgi:hypothetical protein
MENFRDTVNRSTIERGGWLLLVMVVFFFFYGWDVVQNSSLAKDGPPVLVLLPSFLSRALPTDGAARVVALAESQSF